MAATQDDLDNLAAHVRKLALLTEPGAADELRNSVEMAVSDAQDACISALLAAGSEPHENFKYLPSLDKAPDDLFAHADAATCWHLQDLANELECEASKLADAAVWLERAAIALWGNHGHSCTRAERELERDAWRERNRDTLADVLAPRVAA